jgi:hypothetical protein
MIGSKQRWVQKSGYQFHRTQGTSPALLECAPDENQLLKMHAGELYYKSWCYVNAPNVNFS